MTFFERQQDSARKLMLALVLYGLGLVMLAVLVDLVLAAAWRWGFPEIYGARVPAALHVFALAGVIVLVLAFTVRFSFRLPANAEAIARALGARRVPPETRDTLERRVVGILEEMAIASGIRVPALYVMDKEPGVNAFAVATTISDPAIFLTRGVLQNLNRDELNGLCAHEISHVLSGESALNARAVPFLAGLCAVPYAGRACARMIKAVLFRAQDFAADAAGVQFTGNAVAVAGAIDQIGAAASGARIGHRCGEHLSHLFFEEPAKGGLGGMLPSHPPAQQRIDRVLPSFTATEYRRRRVRATAEEADAPARPTLADGKRTEDQAHRWWRTPEESLGIVGALYAEKLEYAQRLMEALPGATREALRRKDGAPALVLALMLARHPEVRRRQLDALKAAGAGALCDAAEANVAQVDAIPAEVRVPALELALPALKLLAVDERKRLVDAMAAVLAADRRAQRPDFVVLAWLRIALGLVAPAKRVRTLPELREDCVFAISLAALGAGAASGDAATKAFRASAHQLGAPDALPIPPELMTAEACTAAIARLRGLAWPAKASLLRSLFAAVAVSGKVRMSEAALVRVMGACLECPMPPLFEAL